MFKERTQKFLELLIFKVKISRKLFSVKVECFILSHSKFFLSYLFCHFFSLMSIKTVALSKKKLYSTIPAFFILFVWTGRYLSYPKILSCSYEGFLWPLFFLCHYIFSVLCGFVAVVCPYMFYLLCIIWFGVQGGKSAHSCATGSVVSLPLWSQKCGCCA